MATIAPTFDRDARDLDKDYGRASHPANGTRPSPAELRAARVKYQKAHSLITSRFAQALATEYTPDLPSVIQESIFQKAWSDGHSSGYHEVEYAYQELANLANQIWVLALTHQQ